MILEDLFSYQSPNISTSPQQVLPVQMTGGQVSA